MCKGLGIGLEMSFYTAKNNLSYNYTIIMELCIAENEDVRENKVNVEINDFYVEDVDEDEDEDDIEELDLNQSSVKMHETIRQPQQQQRPKPRQMTYDDILASLNMKVVDGALQMIQPPMWQQQQQQYKRVNMQNQMQQQQMFQMQNKHQIPVIEKQAPMSLLERKRLLVLNHLKRQAEMQRIRQIKSRKILFPQSNIAISPAIRTNNVGFRFR